MKTRKNRFISTLLATVLLFCGVIAPNSSFTVYASEPAKANSCVITDEELEKYIAAEAFMATADLTRDPFAPLSDEYFAALNYTSTLLEYAQSSFVNTHEIMATNDVILLMMFPDLDPIPGETYDMGTIVLNKSHSQADYFAMTNFLLANASIYFERGGYPDYQSPKKEFVKKHFPKDLPLTPTTLGEHIYQKPDGSWANLGINSIKEISKPGVYKIGYAEHYFSKTDYSMNAVYFTATVIVNAEQV